MKHNPSTISENHIHEAAKAAGDAIAMWTGAFTGKDEQELRLLRRIEGFYWALLQRTPSPEVRVALSTLESLSGGAR